LDENIDGSIPTLAQPPTPSATPKISQFFCDATKKASSPIIPFLINGFVRCLLTPE